MIWTVRGLKRPNYGCEGVRSRQRWRQEEAGGRLGNRPRIHDLDSSWPETVKLRMLGRGEEEEMRAGGHLASMIWTVRGVRKPNYGWEKLG